MPLIQLPATLVALGPATSVALGGVLASFTAPQVWTGVGQWQ